MPVIEGKEIPIGIEIIEMISVAVEVDVVVMSR